MAETLRTLAKVRPLRFVDYDGEVAPTDVETILARRSVHWTLWLQDVG